MTKEQKFLDKLKDPNKAQIKEAIQYFLDSNENMRAEPMVEYGTGYVVVLMAVSIAEMEVAGDNFVAALEKFLDKPGIHVRAHWGDGPKPYSYRRSYYILKESYKTLPW